MSINTRNNTLFHLKSFVFHKEGLPPGTDQLYVRCKNVSSIQGKGKKQEVSIEKGGHLDFFSYFNLFNLTKWRTYTNIGHLFVRLTIQGELRVRIFRHSHWGRSGIPVFDEVIREEGMVTIPVHSAKPAGLYSLRLDAVTDSRFVGGGWYTEVSKNGRTCNNIAVVICTYNREAYVIRNIEVLRQNIPSGWNIFIVDNGRSLAEDIIPENDSRFRLIPNPNTGGSGGFTRGLIEAIRDPVEWSHVLFMDDDIVIEPEVLERTDAFISYLKPEYNSYFISGAMLRMDLPVIQHESGAYWNGFKVRHIKHNYDLTSTKDIIRNESGNRRKKKYAGWWYCAIPITEGHQRDLPLPFFVIGDDIEYSMRKAGGIIQLAGVSVWHEPFHVKHHPARIYLTVRNGLIINARSSVSIIRSLVHIIARLLYHGRRRNTKALKFIIKGVEDFLKGPGYVCTCDESVLFQNDNFDFGEYKNTKDFISRIGGVTIQLMKNYHRITRQYRKMTVTEQQWDLINKNVCN